MKKILSYALLVGLSLSLSPVYSIANSKIETNTTTSIDPSSVTNVVAKAHADALMARLNEIKNMDMSNLNYSEKKLLRKEVKAINNEISKSKNGIYFSFGAIIIVLLLIILI